MKDLLYSHIHGWAPVGKIEKYLENHGVVITELERHNRTDGEYHKRFKVNGESFELKANQWRAESFEPLLKWWRKAIGFNH